MLKSTYKASGPLAHEEPPLPAGWTEHKAPTGHSYYYNAEIKQSTYTRPSGPPSNPIYQHTSPTPPVYSNGLAWNVPELRGPHISEHGGPFRGGLSYQDRARRSQPQDRPKKKKAIPGCEPWVLVTTKLGRRFVYNAEQDESFWKFPPDVLLATFEMDQKEQEDKGRTDRASPKAGKAEEERPAIGAEKADHHIGQNGVEDSDSYEEVEVTDNEEAESGDANGEEHPPKKPRVGLTADSEQPAGPVDFNEDDIAYQLAQMGQDYGLDPGEYGNGDAEEGEGPGEEGYDAGLPLSLEDSQALFHDLLADHAVDPYSTWERILEKDSGIVEDERYIALPSTRARKEAFTTWSGLQIRKIREKRAGEKRKDPRIAYLHFLHDHATPKLYWAEFKRKHRKADAMKDVNLPDKERERMYRDHINRVKLAESTRKKDLKDLLRSSALNQQINLDSTTTALENLPESVLTDIRFISLPAKTRDPLVEAYISTLPPSSTSNNNNNTTIFSSSPSSPFPKHHPSHPTGPKDDQVTAKALRDREAAVQVEKRRAMERMERGRRVMREEEREIEQATSSRGQGEGREVLRGYMDGDGGGGGGGDVGSG